MTTSIYTTEMLNGVKCVTATCLAYGERLPHTEHHFLAEAVVDGPIAAVR